MLNPVCLQTYETRDQNHSRTCQVRLSLIVWCLREMHDRCVPAPFSPRFCVFVCVFSLMYKLLKKTMTFTLTAMFFYVAYHLTLPYKNILSISHQPWEQKCMSGRKLNVGCYPSCLPVVVSASMIWTDASVFKDDVNWCFCVYNGRRFTQKPQLSCISNRITRVCTSRMHTLALSRLDVTAKSRHRKKTDTVTTTTTHRNGKAPIASPFLRLSLFSNRQSSDTYWLSPCRLPVTVGGSDAAEALSSTQVERECSLACEFKFAFILFPSLA